MVVPEIEHPYLVKTDNSDKKYCVTICCGPTCNHDNGWYVTVTFLYIFNKNVFVCSDCGKVLTRREHESGKK